MSVQYGGRLSRGLVRAFLVPRADGAGSLLHGVFRNKPAQHRSSSTSTTTTVTTTTTTTTTKKPNGESWVEAEIRTVYYPPVNQGAKKAAPSERNSEIQPSGRAEPLTLKPASTCHIKPLAPTNTVVNSCPPGSVTVVDIHTSKRSSSQINYPPAPRGANKAAPSERNSKIRPFSVSGEHPLEPESTCNASKPFAPTITLINSGPPGFGPNAADIHTPSCGTLESSSDVGEIGCCVTEGTAKLLVLNACEPSCPKGGTEKGTKVTGPRDPSCPKGTGKGIDVKMAGPCDPSCPTGNDGADVKTNGPCVSVEAASENICLPTPSDETGVDPDKCRCQRCLKRDRQKARELEFVASWTRPKGAPSPIQPCACTGKTRSPVIQPCSVETPTPIPSCWTPAKELTSFKDLRRKIKHDGDC